MGNFCSDLLPDYTCHTGWFGLAAPPRFPTLAPFLTGPGYGTPGKCLPYRICFLAGSARYHRCRSHLLRTSAARWDTLPLESRVHLLDDVDSFRPFWVNTQFFHRAIGGRPT